MPEGPVLPPPRCFLAYRLVPPPFMLRAFLASFCSRIFCRRLDFTLVLLVTVDERCALAGVAGVRHVPDTGKGVS
jgi:hypothetical protein